MTRFSFVILTACLFIIILTADSYALRLNEIEANPEGEDSGFEWLELYSDDSVSLEGYYLDHNSSGGPVNLSGSFSGYFIVTFPTQWLRNTNEVVYLKLNGNVVDTAGPFSDNKKEKTYSLCNSGWVFTTETRNSENSCSSGGTQTGGQNQNGSSNSQNNNNNNQNSNEEQNQVEDSGINEEVEVNNNKPNLTSLSSTNGNDVQKPKKIVLNSKTDEKEVGGEVTKTYKTRIGVIYFFMALCVLLVVLIALRKL